MLSNERINITVGNRRIGDDSEQGANGVRIAGGNQHPAEYAIYG